MKSQTKSIAENWKMNLIEKLGLEKCKAIVEGAPYPIIGYCLVGNNWIHKQCDSAPTRYSSEDNSWSEDYAIDFVSIDDLRADLADHERTDTCSDIRNHISPNTKVIER